MSKIFEELGEDIEREYLKDEMYLMEEQMKMEEEYWQWEEENKEPAKIEVILPTVKKEQDGVI
jgi:hypothetical protein